MQSTEQRLTKRQRYWFGHIQSWQSSGKTIADYSKDQGFTAQAMYAGKKELVKKGALPRSQKPRFQRAKLVNAVVDNQWPIRLPNGLSVNFTGAVNAEELSKVISTLLSVA